MSSQLRQSLSPAPAFDSGYESRNESFPKPSGESRVSAKKARDKANERQRRDKVAHYMGELREVLPPTMRPGFKGIGYAGGQLAVMETALRYTLQLNIDVDVLEGKQIDAVTSEAMSILEALSDDSENEAVTGTRERKRKIREILLVKKFREVLLLMSESGNTYPKWMVLHHAAIYIKQLEQRKQRLEGMRTAQMPSMLVLTGPPCHSEGTREQRSSQSQDDCVEQESRDGDLHGPDILPEHWQSLSDRMTLSRQQSLRMQEYPYKIHFENADPRNRGRRHPRIEKTKRRAAKIRRPDSPSEGLLESLKGLSTVTTDIRSVTASPSIVGSINQPPGRLVHGFSIESRIPERNREHQLHEGVDTHVTAGPPGSESPGIAHSHVNTIRRLPPIVSILNHEEESADNREDSSQLPPASPGWEREISASSAYGRPIPFFDRSPLQDRGIQGRMRGESNRSHQPYPAPGGESSATGMTQLAAYPTFRLSSMAAANVNPGDPLRLPPMSSIWDEARVAVYGEWPVEGEQRDIPDNRESYWKRT